MPWQEGTLTPDDVAEHLSAVVDDRMVDATDESRAYCQNLRSNTPPYELWSNAAWHGAGRRYAGLLYRSKAAPAGFASFEPSDPGEFTEYARAMSQLGSDPVIA